MTLEEALFRLLHHRGYREAFLTGDWQRLGLTPEDREDLDVVDRRELERTARRIVINLLAGGGAGEHGLRGAFPRTLECLEAEGYDPPALVMDFMESPEFDRYQETGFAKCGVCAEEAFYAFLIRWIDDDTEIAQIATHEICMSIASLLVVNPNPAFQIETLRVHDNGSCKYLLQSYQSGFPCQVDCPAPTLMLYAATPLRLIHGPIPRWLVDILQLGSASEAEARQQSASDDEWPAMIETLTESGLISH